MKYLLIGLMLFAVIGCRLKNDDDRDKENASYNEETMRRCENLCKPYKATGFISNQRGCICSK